MSDPFAVIVPAAGVGRRSGATLPKQYVEIAGRMVLAHTLARFLAIEECREIVVAVDDDWREQALACGGDDPRLRLVTGGSERQDSIAAALAALESDAGIVLVHDAARPCLTASLIRRVVAGAARHRAVIPIVPVAETVKRIEGRGAIVETLDRSQLALAQTPQGFERSLLVEAYHAAARTGARGTDDASLVEALGVRVMSVAGERRNLKITEADDFSVAEMWLRVSNADES